MAATFEPRRPNPAQADIMAKHAGYPFRWSDGGRSLSARRQRQRNDCTVRALALVCFGQADQDLGFGVAGLHYDAIDQLLTEDAGKGYGSGIVLDRWLLGRMDPVLDPVRPVFGWTAKRVTFPAVKGQRRMNPVTFAAHYPKGRWVVFVAKHVYAVIDGVAYDTSPERTDRCIYQAWEFYASQGRGAVMGAYGGCYKTRPGSGGGDASGSWSRVNIAGLAAWEPWDGRISGEGKESSMPRITGEGEPGERDQLDYCRRCYSVAARKAHPDLIDAEHPDYSDTDDTCRYTCRKCGRPLTDDDN